jgi:hypothetical protein
MKTDQQFENNLKFMFSSYVKNIFIRVVIYGS